MMKTYVISLMLQLHFSYLLGYIFQIRLGKQEPP